MSRDFQQTHENLLVCAKKHFLLLGFEKASIREICKDANVTNGAFYRHFNDKEALFGALVDPVINEVDKIYSNSVRQHIELVHTVELNSIWQLSERTIVEIIEYIYDHFDEFRLILMNSEGTRYSSFLDDVVRMEVRETILLFHELKSQKVFVRDLDEEEWHMLIHAFYSSLTEVVLHNYPKEAAVKYAHTLFVFFSSGWQHVLGI